MVTYQRSLLIPERFYIQFIQFFVGSFWFLFYWLKHQKYFDWIADMPFECWTINKILIFTSHLAIGLLIMFMRISQIWLWGYLIFLLIGYLLSYHHLISKRTVSNKSVLVKIAEYG